jgi:carboxypeptidase C (cathepsin A)
MKFLRQLVSFLLYHFVAVSAIRIPPSQQRQRQQHEVFRTLSFNNNVNVTVPTDAKEHLVTAPLPLWKGDPFPTQHWAGHLPASSDGDKYFFYWLFAPEYSTTTFNKEDVPLVIWLNGGPGCSSMDGLFLENGPFRFVKDTPDGAYYLTAANFSWHTVPASTLYIDQPVGTGLSFTTSNKYPTNDQEVNTDFYYFLQQFVSLHGNYKQVYVSGESHAGHYIPSMMNYILQQNDNLKGGNVAIKLAGAAMYV